VMEPHICARCFGTESGMLMEVESVIKKVAAVSGISLRSVDTITKNGLQLMFLEKSKTLVRTSCLSPTAKPVMFKRNFGSVYWFSESVRQKVKSPTVCATIMCCVVVAFVHCEESFSERSV